MLAEEFDVDQTTILGDLKIVRESIPPEDREQLRAQHLDQFVDLTHELRALVTMRPAPVMASKDGDIVRDPETRDPVWDHGGRFAAVDRLLRAQERVAKLVGLDSPTESNVKVENRTPEIVVLIEQARAEQAAAEADLKT